MAADNHHYGDHSNSMDFSCSCVTSYRHPLPPSVSSLSCKMTLQLLRCDQTNNMCCYNPYAILIILIHLMCHSVSSQLMYWLVLDGTPRSVWSVNLLDKHLKTLILYENNMSILRILQKCINDTVFP